MMRRGFTIVELLIVIVVIAILAAITIVAYNGIQNQAKVAALTSELSQAAKAVETYKAKNTAAMYPTALSQVEGLNTSGYDYFYNQRQNTYCIERANGALRYSMNAGSSPREGRCMLNCLLAWLPLNGSLEEAVAGVGVSPSGAVSVTQGANGKQDGAYQIGASGMLTLATANLPSSLSSFSISVWARGVSGTSGDYSYVVYRGAGSSIGSSIYWLGILPNGNYSLAVNGQYNAGNTNVAGSSTTWRHLVLTYDGSRQYMYVDGTLRGEVAIGSISNATTSNSLTVGAGPGNYRSFSGTVDDVRVYSRALSATEVTNTYTEGAF